MSQNSPGAVRSNPAPPVSNDTGAQSGEQGGSRRPSRGGIRRSNNPNRSAFNGKEEKLKGHAYDVQPYKNGKVFTRTTKELAEFAAREYPNAGEFRQALQKLEYEALVEPVWNPKDADAPTVPEIEQYKLLYKSYFDKKHKREESQKKIYALILGQCTQAMVDRLEASEEYEDVNNSNDPVELLKLIRSCIYQKHVTKKPVHAFIDAEYALLTLRQESNQSLSSYYEKFKEVVQVYQNLGGEAGASTGRISEKLIAQDPDFPT